MTKTIYDVTKPVKGRYPIVMVLMGSNQTNDPSRTAYRFQRPVFPNGMAETLPSLAEGRPFMWMDDEWVCLSGSKRNLIAEWSREVTVLDVTYKDPL